MAQRVFWFLCQAWIPASALAQADAQPAAKPHIVLLVADDLGYCELGCQGNPLGNLDPEWHLHDLANDMGEADDLVRTRPAKFAELKARWDESNGEMIERNFR